MQAEIITIGDEILIGQIIDSNSAWIAQKLNGIGVHIKQISSVADNTEDIQVALKLASNRADIILITGGLGPTKDDVTKQTLCKYFNCQLRRDEQVLQHVTSIFERSQRPMLELNRRQADVLDNCEVLFNVLGTAPGMWVKTKKNHYIIMPGVPFEMQHIMETHVIPKLKTLEDRLPIWHHTMITGGIGESFLAEKIADIENSLPSHIHLAYLPKLGTVRLRLTAIGADEKKLKAETQHISEQLKDRIGIHFLANEDISIESLVSETLLRYKKTLSTAESCTGGNIARCITSLPGSSRIFEGSAVTYSNALKVKLVNVNPATLEQYGAVSEETVREMVTGARDNFNTDYAIAVSGIAGPDGGTQDKPVGQVWIAVASRNQCISQVYQFGKDRSINIERATAAALLLLLKVLKEEN